MVEKLTYYVTHDGDERWKVRFRGEDFPHVSREAATKAAIEAAHRTGLTGKDTRVVAWGGKGWRLRWTFGDRLTRRRPISETEP